MILETRYRQRGALMWLTVPFVYGISIPIAFLDLSACIYQAVCFPIYGIPKVNRRNFFRFDRKHLSYLGKMDKINCVYCAYANGVVAFAKEVAVQTERYWCPIRNKIGGDFHEPEHHKDFASYNDKAALEGMIDKNAP